MSALAFAQFRRRFQQDPLAGVGKVPGIFLVDKPRGLTSHDVVDIARRRLGLEKVGHGGTLDPIAEGLLLILAGRATRLFDSLQQFEKCYHLTLRLGERTDTQDLTGKVIAAAAAGALPLAREQMAGALERFRGEIMQTPPMYSAVKKNGQPLYKLARQGQTVAREPRPITVHELKLVGFDGFEAELEMTVSKGFYARTLVDDLGQVLGPGAVMTALTRTRIGPFKLAAAVKPEEINAA